MPSALMTFVLVVHSLIAVALVTTILLQRSEGGALGIGGGPGGLMSARGAGNLLTRATGVLAAIFLGTSILLAVLANLAQAPAAIDTSLTPATAAEAPATLPASPEPLPAGGDLPFALPGTPPADAPPASDEIPTAQ